jgi:ankyrin repeat protein
MMKPLLLTFLAMVTVLTHLLAQKNASQLKADSLLLASSLHGNVQEIKEAIRMGADVNAVNENGASPLNMVSKLSYEFLVRYFIGLGANVNTANNDKITPLHWGVEYNNLEIVKLLLKKKANLDARDGINETPLHWAAWTGNYESAKWLLKYGANPRAGNNSGVTPIDLAKRQEHDKLYRLLIKKRFTKNRVN